MRDTYYQFITKNIIHALKITRSSNCCMYWLFLWHHLPGLLSGLPAQRPYLLIHLQRNLTFSKLPHRSLMPYCFGMQCRKWHFLVSEILGLYCSFWNVRVCLLVILLTTVQWKLSKLKRKERVSQMGESETEREREWERERNKKGFTRIVLSSLECERGLACYNENKIINTVFVYRVLKFQCGSEIVKLLQVLHIRKVKYLYFCIWITRWYKKYVLTQSFRKGSLIIDCWIT